MPPDAHPGSFSLGGSFCATPGDSIHRAAERNCLINSWKALRLWFADTRDALIGLLGLVLAAHETPE